MGAAIGFARATAAGWNGRRELSILVSRQRVCRILCGRKTETHRYRGRRAAGPGQRRCRTGRRLESGGNHRVRSLNYWTSSEGARDRWRGGGRHTTRNGSAEPPISAVSTRWPAFDLLCPRCFDSGRLCWFARWRPVQAARHCGCRGRGVPFRFPALPARDDLVCASLRPRETRTFWQSVSCGRTGGLRCSIKRRRIFRDFGHFGLPDRLRRCPATDVAGSIRQKSRCHWRSRQGPLKGRGTVSGWEARRLQSDGQWQYGCLAHRRRAECTHAVHLRCGVRSRARLGARWESSRVHIQSKRRQQPLREIVERGWSG